MNLVLTLEKIAFIDITVPGSQQACDSTAIMNSKRISTDTASSLFSSWKYDVFLSFRSEDTRMNFVDHLYTALNQKGIFAFRDDKELERGKFISEELLKAIEESRFSLVIFSRNYASSTWCLDELVKIVECMKTMGQRVLPVFYHVNPSMVRKQSGPFQEAFAKHEKVFSENMKNVANWRSALTKAANLSGWDAKDRHESVLIQDIVKEISRNLNPTTFINIKDLVGINSRLEKLKRLINTGSKYVRMIGICGMGGIGKTTIARVVYELISHEFKESFFLANVKEISKKSGLLSLQEQILLRTLQERYNNIYNVYDGMCKIKNNLQHKKVVVVDDVSHVQQLEALVGKPEWFGLGSRIIITTRDKHLLKTHGVDAIYEAKELNDDEALQLLILKAFKNHEPSKDFMELSKRVVKYVAGLPLALKVLGSFLYGKNIVEWEDALRRLYRDFEMGIMERLRISFDGLDETEKKIFLDIACFFKGNSRDYVTKILDGCGFNPTIGIKFLVDKSLVTILVCNKLWMHDLLQEMGQQIVKRESPDEPGNRSRLWEEADIHHVLTRNTGSNVVEGIMLNFPIEEVYCSPDVFSKMIKLRLLKICKVQLPKGLKYLPDELRLLDWVGYPLKSLPSNLKLDKFVELNLNSSHIEQPWKGIKVFKALTSVNFKWCRYIKKTPDFTEAPNLNEVILVRCIRLHKIHSSLLLHKKITTLSLSVCKSLRTLPKKIHMESLQWLSLYFCSNLKYFPEITGSMKSLSTIHLEGTAIKELPMSFGLLTGLKWLYLRDCKNLMSLPVTINGLTSLQTLNLSCCSRLENLPDTLAQLESLRWLDVSGTVVRQPMSSIFLMEKLEELDFRGCKGSPSHLLSSLFPLMCFVPVRSSYSMAFKLPSLSGLCSSLTTLILSNCNLGEETIPGDFFDSFSSLWKLDLSNNNFVSLPRSIDRLSGLVYLNVNGCTSLETISNALNLLNISCVNCLKLIEGNSIAFSMVKDHINKFRSRNLDSYPSWRRFKDRRLGTFSMIVPGIKIPKWFNDKCEGDKLRIKRHQIKMHQNSELEGYLVCFVLDACSYLDGLQVRCSLESNGKMLTSPDGVKLLNIDFVKDKEFGQAVSDHLALVYFPRESLDWSRRITTKSHAMWFLFFGSLIRDLAVKVKRCGVHAVYNNEPIKMLDCDSCWDTDED